MNFRVDFNSPATLPGVVLVCCYTLAIILASLLGGCFIDWQLPNARHFRAIALLSMLIPIAAYFNKDTK